VSRPTGGRHRQEAELRSSSFHGREHEVQVRNGFYLFAVWGIPDSTIHERPIVRRFID
jgi:hypothetical protein